MCPSAFRVSSPRSPGGEGAGIKPGPKPSLERWECVCKTSLRSVQGFGFPLALHIPTDKQTNKHLYAYFYIYRWKQRHMVFCRQNIRLRNSLLLHETTKISLKQEDLTQNENNDVWMKKQKAFFPVEREKLLLNSGVFLTTFSDFITFSP